MATMQAAVAQHPGGPEVLVIEERPIPEPQQGWLRIRVHAFGLNRAEIYTRRGESPGVAFPRILGIEATGSIDIDPTGAFQPGETVATVMGGMGRNFDGGYAQYVCVPATQVRRLKTKLDWAKLGAMPEMLQTAWGALYRSMQIQPGQTLLIRGGTSSVGLAAIALARRAKLTVHATTRNPARAAFLQSQGAEPIIDTGSIKDEILARIPAGIDRVLDLVGTKTLADSLACLALHGIGCIAGGLGDEWAFPNFAPSAIIPAGSYLTCYGSRVDVMQQMPWEDLLADIEAGSLTIPLGPTFQLNQIVEAHRFMETNQSPGKLVVLT
jgi:NADPH:quinone reductase-like Zn-dependent oxidoreductase